jgi:hypothetical protein
LETVRAAFAGDSGLILRNVSLTGDRAVLQVELAGLRDDLVACGFAPGEIVDGSPGPRHEMRVADPDGYVLTIAQIDAET